MSSFFGIGGGNLGEKIWKAAEANDKSTLESLLKKAKQSDLRYVDKSGVHSTALTIAAHRGHVGLIGMLIAAGSDVSQADPEHGNTALIWATVKNHPDVVRELLQAKPNINHQAKNGNTALICAVSHGNPAIAQELLKAGADPSLRNKDNETAADRAKSSELKALLLSSSTAAKTSLLLWEAAERGSAADVHTHLQKATPSDLRFVNTAGLHSTALTVAAHRGHVDCVNLLIAAGCDVNQQDAEYRNNALIWACVNNHLPVVRALIKANANLNLQAKNGNSALICAAAHGHLKLTQELLEAGADTTLVNEDGKSALQKATDKDIKALLTNWVSRTPTAKSGSATSSPTKAAPNSPTSPAATTPTTRTADPTSTAKAPAASTPQAVAAAELAALRQECRTLTSQANKLPTLRAAVRLRDSLQQQFDAADAEGTDFKRIAALGKALKATKADIAQLPLSEADAQTLPARHAALVERITNKCKDLRKAEDFETLEAVAELLEGLQGLDVAGAAGVDDDDGSNDPVYVTTEQLEQMELSAHIPEG